jgi:predicted DNA-binding transcriptional regulator YafY
MANPFANSVKFLTAISLLASPQGATIRSLMDGLTISRRTTFRLLDALEGLGFPLINDQHGPRGEKTYRLMDRYVHKMPNISIPDPGFTREEIEAIISLIDSIENSRKPRIGPPFKLIRQKCVSLLQTGRLKRARHDKAI